MKRGFFQKRKSALIFSLLFCFVLVSIPAVTIWRPKESRSYYENRDFATIPDFNWETVADGSYFRDLESYFCDQAALRTTVLKFSAWLDLKLFRRPVVNDVVIGDDLLLACEAYETVDSQAIAALADQTADGLKQLSLLVESYGGNFLYVAVPSHYAYFADRYPTYLNNRSAYTETANHAFFSALEERQVPYLDVGQLWEQEGSPREYMSSVDHHWTLAGCLSAYRQVMAHLNEQSGLGLAVLGDEDLVLNTLPNPYLGSRARKLCGQWESTEKLSYATLLNPIPFTRWNNGQETTPALFASPSSQRAPVDYTFYMGGDISETLLDTNRPELPSILIYGDSFTNLMETLLYASFDETRSLDLRGYDTMSLLDYVELYQPKVVLCIRDYEQLLNLTGNGKIS